MSAFDTTVRFRLPKALKARLERIASLRVKTLPELGREAVVEFVEREESRTSNGEHKTEEPEPKEVVNG